MTPLLTLLLVKRNKWCQVTEICQTFFMAFVVYGWGRIRRGGDKGYVFTSPAFSNYIFDKYKFSIISRLFDNNKLYA